MSFELRAARSIPLPNRTEGPCTPRPGGRIAWMVRLPLLVVSLVTSVTASAATYPTRSIGDWVLSASSDQKGCFLSRTYPAPRQTTLQLGLDTDGSNRVSILNPHWSIRPRQKLTLDFRLSNVAFPRHVAIGIASQDKRGFVSSFGRSFPASFAASRFLHVRRGDVPVEELDLDGSGAAIAELRTCVAHYRTAPGKSQSAPRAEARIPTDPFSNSPDRDSRN